MDAGAPAVFFSFSSKDQKIAETICAALEARGFSCWLATRDVKPGANYQSSIVRAIKAAKVLVLVFSANTNQSDEIKKELSLASRQRMPVIPVRVEDVLPDEGLSYELATRQWIDLFADWETAMSRLAEQISLVAPPGAPTGAIVLPPALPAKLPFAPMWAIGAVAALVLAAGAYLYLGSGPSQRVDHPAPQTPTSTPTAAGGPSQPDSVKQMLRCMQADADKAIMGCTLNLNDASITGATRAGYLKFRASAYVTKFDYDRALADYDAAITIMPKDGQLYYLRSTVKRVKGDLTGADADATRAKELGYAVPPH